MDILTDSHRVQRLEIVETRGRRRFSVSEKLRIVVESFSGPRLASSTARRHGISNTLLFAWRKAYREGRLGEDGLPFVPVAIGTPAGTEPATIGCEAPCHRPVRRALGLIEIDLGNERRVIVDRDVDADALRRVLAVLGR